MHAVEPGHADHQMVLFHRHCPTRTIRRDLAGNPVDLGFIDVTKPELDLGAEVVANTRLQLCPAWRGDDDVDAERQPLGGQILNLPLKVGELADKTGPSVDDQKDVAVWIGRNGLTWIVTQLPVHPDRAHSVFLEGGFPLPHDGLHLCDHPVDLVGLGPIGYPTDVWKVFEIDQPAAT